jgi:DNA-binding CsgD family transcriptional regulator
LTHKQHEVLQLVADNWTSKEIAARLGVTESAINQRIEAVRMRAGSLPRAQIARAYRHFLAERSTGVARLSDYEAGPLHAAEAPEPRTALNELVLAGGMMPKRFTGSNGRLNRVATMVFIAAGMMLVTIGGLAVAQVLTMAH